LAWLTDLLFAEYSYAAIIAFISLFAIPFAPRYNIQTTTAPTSLFFEVPIKQRSLLKLISINFCLNQYRMALQPILPTIFGLYILNNKRPTFDWSAFHLHHAFLLLLCHCSYL
jgi:hypothetical protein